MATAPPNLPVTSYEEEQVHRAEEQARRKEEQARPAEQRRILREKQLEENLLKLEVRHQEERRALSQELWELADGRKAIREQLRADWFSGPFPDLDREESRRSSQQEDGASSSSAASNGQEGPGEGDEEISISEESVSKASQQRKERQAHLKELLPAKNELHVDVQRLLEVLDKELFRKAYDYRIKVEDPHEIEAHQRTEAAREAAREAGRCRFVSKEKVEEKRRDIEQKRSAKEEIAYVDGQKLGYPKLPVCYEEIKKLLDIEKNPIFSATLKEWNRKEELYNGRVECWKHRLVNLKNEVYQLIGFFSVFQGVVLTAVSQSSFLYCHNKWSPIALSVLASVISTLAVTQKLIRINDLETNIDSEERNYKTAVEVGKLLRAVQEEERLREPLPIGSEERDYKTAVQVGKLLRAGQVGERLRAGQEEERLGEPLPKGIDFFQLNLEIERNANRKSKWSTKRDLFSLYSVSVILTLVAFGVLFPVSFWSILCKPGSPPAPAAQ